MERAWKEHGCWKTKTALLGKYLALIDADLSAIDMAVKEASSALRKRGKRIVEIVSTSRKALTTVSRTGQWVSPLVKDNLGHTNQLQAQNFKLTLFWTLCGRELGGVASTEAAARQAVRQQPRHMRSALLPYVKQCVKAERHHSKPNKHIGIAKKSVAARYL
jgi:hypothetical protein